MTLATSLAALAQMQDNWDGRHSMAPTEAAIRTADNIHAVPLGSGGIQIGLYAGGAEIEIEISPTGNVISVCWTKIQG